MEPCYAIGDGKSGSALHYDKDSISPISKNIVKVWTKEIFSKEGVEDAVAKLGNHYAKLSYVLTLWQMNCLNRELKPIQATAYDSDGSRIETEAIKTEWIAIGPETMGEAVYKVACPPKE